MFGFCKCEKFYKKTKEAFFTSVVITHLFSALFIRKHSSLFNEMTKSKEQCEEKKLYREHFS